MNGDPSPAGVALLGSQVPAETPEQKRKRLASIASLQQRLSAGSPAGMALINGGAGSYGMAFGG